MQCRWGRALSKGDCGAGMGLCVAQKGVRDVVRGRDHANVQCAWSDKV